MFFSSEFVYVHVCQGWGVGGCNTTGFQKQGKCESLGKYEEFDMCGFLIKLFLILFSLIINNT